ncbi:MAG: glucokinase [Legionella sp.]|nr:MAG: glucokinase [Legionella sp.]
MTDYKNNYAIVADIGGTFARFARVNLIDLVIDEIEVLSCVDYISLELAFTTYVLRHSLSAIKKVSIAIACPVLGDLVAMTNHHWQFSIKALKEQLELEELHVINDFFALAKSLSVLTREDFKQIGAASGDLTHPKVILGAGTGLGMGYTLSNTHAFAAGGGHVSWGATTEQEWFIYQYLQQKYGHVSQERILSGQGLEHIYIALSHFYKADKPELKAEAIIPLALSQEDVIAQRAVKQFFICLARYAGDLALSFGAFGGVYLAGGVVTRLLPLLEEREFREHFEAKGRFKTFNTTIPTFVMTAKQPGILGAAVSLKQSLQGAVNVIH